MVPVRGTQNLLTDRAGILSPSGRPRKGFSFWNQEERTLPHRNFPSSSSRPSTSLYELARCMAAATTAGAAAAAANAIHTGSIQKALASILSARQTIINPELIRILDRLEERERLSHLTDDSQNN